MSNYLQRIAVSAAPTTSPAKPLVPAPTTSPAKPLVPAPTIMPRVAAPAWLPTTIDGSQPAETLPDLESPPLPISPPPHVVLNRQSAVQLPDVSPVGDVPPRVARSTEPQSREQINQEASIVPPDSTASHPV